VRYLKANRLVERVAEIEATFFAKLAALRERPIVGDVRGRGLLAGVELVADRETKRPFARSARVAERVAEAALDRGLVVWPNVGHLDGGDGDILMLGPPFTVSEAEIDEIVARLSLALERAFGREGHG
jgi:adenosylmethionine-8-amino-7-oxononanoate aminotransferase